MRLALGIQARGSLQQPHLHLIVTTARGQVRAAAAAPTTAMASAKAPRLYIGALPITTPPQEVKAAIADAVGTSYGEVERVEIAQADKRLLRRHQDALHAGYAFVAFRDPGASEAAAAALRGLAIGGLQQKVSVERKRAEPEREGEEAAEAVERRQAQREHSQRKHKRRAVRRVEGLERVLERIPAPGGRAAPGAVAYDLSAGGGGGGGVDWPAMPAPLDPQRGGGLGAHPDGTVGGELETPRSARKRLQVESFALVLRRLAAAAGAGRRRGGGAAAGGGGEDAAAGAGGLRVVDFGCGSGNLVLPLAWLFPGCLFEAIDMKEASVDRLRRRAEEAGLANVSAAVGMIEDHQGDFDVALALHACGNATDHALLAAEARRAAFAVCPCCVGKLKFSLKGGSAYKYPPAVAVAAAGSGAGAVAGERARAGAGPESVAVAGGVEGAGGAVPLRHPRSEWLRGALEDAEADFASIARAADISHAEGAGKPGAEHSHEEVARLCKLHVELDRAAAAGEGGYRTALLKLLEPSATAKSDLLVGVPGEGPWEGAADPTAPPPPQ